MIDESKRKLIRLRFDLDRIKQIADVGVKRAALFMGLGLHAANRADLRDYELNKLPAMEGQLGIPVELIPTNAPAEVVDEFKREFGTWVIGCGLREMLEHYALAVDEIHRGTILILHIRGHLSRAQLPELQRVFHRISGLPAKLRELERRSGITPKYRDHMDSLYKVRNCLTHGAGLVTPTQADGNGLLRLKWRALEVFAQDPKGQGELVGRQILGVTFAEGGEIKGRTVERERSFKLGETIRLSQQDLWEICFFFAMECIPSLLDSSIAFADKQGIPVNRLPS